MLEMRILRLTALRVWGRAQKSVWQAPQVTCSLESERHCAEECGCWWIVSEWHQIEQKLGRNREAVFLEQD